MVAEEYGINEETVRIIGEFSILWCAFESMYFKSNLKPPDLQLFSESVAEVAKTDEKFSKLYESIQFFSAKRFGKITKKAIQSRLFSDKHKGKKAEIDSISKFLKGSTKEMEMWGCMIYVQCIRNNLFHGLKEIASLDSQKDLFISICNLLSYFTHNESLYTRFHRKPRPTG